MAAATLTLLVLTLTGQTVALRSDKPFVTSEDSAQIELSAVDGSGRPLRDAQVSLTVNVGSVTEPAPTQDGAFRAIYRPPSQEGAQVALFHATVKQGDKSSGSWLALPVHGPYSLRVKAPPRARVRVSIGAASYGPVVASTGGEATVPVKLPPGVTSAQVTIVERSGKSRTQTVPLPEPRFPRVQLVALEAPIQGRPVQLQGFVVDDSGNPAVALPPITVSVEQGTLGLIEAKEGGVFELPYTASTQSAAPVIIAASPVEESERSSSLQVEPRPASSASATGFGATANGAPMSDSGAVASSSQPKPWQSTLGAFVFLHSNAASAHGGSLQLEGAVRLASLPLEALLQLELRGNSPVTESLVPDSPNPVTKTFNLSGGGARLGVRWSHPFLEKGLFFADATAGILRMTGSVKVESEEGSINENLRSVGPAVALGGGVGWKLGPGRVCGQLNWGYAPGRQSVNGNLGGLSLGLGYQLTVGGKSTP